MDIPVYNADGELVEQFSIDEAPLGGKPSRDLVRQAVLTYEANQRVGGARAKRRDEVVSSGRKPWPQKHTGRARHGDRGSPIWIGGGVAHGPRPRDHGLKMNRKARTRATHAAFLLKARDGEVIAIDRLDLPRPKTKEMALILRNLGVQRSFLIVLPEHDATLWRCTRNIRGAAMMAWRELNAHEMIRPGRVIFTLEALRQFV
ncbi:MAG: 50S ribosomal protein L4, partial [Candidatus Brocadiaceae bacterium]